MKKINIFIILTILTAGLFSCLDNEDFSLLHELTADEIAEIARQDSIAKAQKEYINADLILDYTINITISGSVYDGGMLAIGVDTIAEYFGISEAELLAGIAGESGAPEIKGFAIDSTTHLDYGSASTTGSPWGHWWGANGNVSEWVSETNLAMTFCEFNYETGEFNIGQFPGRLVDGQTIVVIEALKYNDIRVAVRIKINAIAAGELDVAVVSSQDLTIDVTPKSTYDADALQFNLDEVLTDLDVSSMDEVSFVAVKEDGSYDQEAVTGKGYWYYTNGFAGVWGDDAVIYTNYGDFESDQISIGQFPDHLTADQSLVIQYGILANNKIVMLNITINVAGYQDPETAPEGHPEAVSMDVELSKAYSDDYASVTADVKETMRNAFKMTTYQIHQAITSGELKLYQGEVTDVDPAYTSDAPGYWLKPDGTPGEWAESLVWCSIGHNETDLYVYAGNHPDNAVAGDVVTTTYIATCNGGAVTFNITFTVEGDSYVDPETAPEGDPEALSVDIELSKAYSNDYANITAELKETMRNAFKMTTYQIHSAISTGELKLYQGEVSETAPVYTADAPGYWLKADGTPGEWAEGLVWCSIGHTENELYLYGGNHPDNGIAGSTVTTTYIITLNGGSVTVNLTFKVE